jgi:hypothetical protein
LLISEIFCSRGIKHRVYLFPSESRRASFSQSRVNAAVIAASASVANQPNDEVLHRGQGPQGWVQVEVPEIYTIIQRMPVEADGRLRYRIKSDKIERVVTEDELSYGQ